MPVHKTQTLKSNQSLGTNLKFYIRNDVITDAILKYCTFTTYVVQQSQEIIYPVDKTIESLNKSKIQGI